MSDTPRTDKIMFTVDVCDGEDVVNLWFARNLERELNVANLQMELLTKSNFQLREDRLELKQRIKRLEEAGDARCENSNPSRWDSPADAARKLTEQSNWRKAKEAKP